MIIFYIFNSLNSTHEHARRAFYHVMLHLEPYCANCTTAPLYKVFLEDDRRQRKNIPRTQTVAHCLTNSTACAVV